MIRSAAPMARCTKSPAESAAQPMNLSLVSSTTPLPSWVETNGMPVFSMNWLSIRLVMVRLAPAPITRIGELGLLDALGGGADRLLVGHRTPRIALRHRRCVGLLVGDVLGELDVHRPGLLLLRQAERLADLEGMLSAEASWWVYLVSGPSSTTSRIWNRPCLDFLMGFWPVIIIIGMPPSWA
jgi:hypothetical protein